MTFDFDTMLNYQLSQKLKLIERYKFNHLLIILIVREIDTFINFL